jgi:hypothetical protein
MDTTGIEPYDADTTRTALAGTPRQVRTEQKMLGEMEHKREYLEQPLLHISGALQI